jgi:signal transduction histidine kinase/ActR/RegA family two-component response regulator
VTRPALLTDAHRDVLFELGQLMGQRTSLEDVFAGFAERILNVAAFDHASLFVVEPDARWARLVAAYPLADQLAGGDARFLSVELGLAALAAIPGGYEYSAAEVGIRSTQELHAAGYERAWAGALVVDGEVYGAYTVARRDAAPFRDEDLAFLRAASAILAVAVRDDVQVARLRQQAGRSAVVNELALLFNAGKPMEAIFERFRELLHGVLQFDYLALSLLERDRYWQLAGSWPGPGTDHAPPFARTEVDITDVIAAGTRVVQYRPSHHTGFWSEMFAARGLERAAVSILRSEGRTLGAVAFGRTSKLPFHADDVSFIELVCTMLEQAVHNGLRRQQAIATAARSQLLNEVALLLTAGERIEPLWDRMLALIERALDFDYIGLLETTATPGELRMVGSRPEIVRGAGERTTVAAAALDRMFELDGVVQYRTDRVDAGTTGALLAAGIVRVAAVVLWHGGELMGELAVGRQRNRAFSSDECEFLQTVGNLLAQAVANQLRFRRIEEDAARSDLLNELSMLLNAGEHVEALFDRLPAMLRQAVPLDYVGLAVPGEGELLSTMDWNAQDPGTVHRSDLSHAETGLAFLGEAPATIHEFEVRRGVTPLLDGMYRAGLRRSAVAVLRHREQALGLLHVSRAGGMPFTAEQLAFLEVVARLFAQAVANQLRIAASAAEAEDEGILASVGAVVAHESNSRALISALTAPIWRFIPDSIIVFGYLEGDHVRFLGPRQRQVVRAIGARVREALEVGQVAVGGREFMTDTRVRADAEASQVESAVVTTAQSAGAAVGVLVVSVHERNFVFTPRMLRLLTRIAALLGPAMAHTFAAEQVAIEATEQRILTEVAAAAARESEPAALLTAVTRPLRAFISRPLVGFGHIDGETAIYHIPGLGEYGLPLTPLEQEAIEHGQAAAAEIEDHAPPGHHVRGRDLHAAVLTAFHSGGVATGLLAVGSRDPAFAFSDRDMRFFRLMAQIVGPAMEAARAAHRTREEAEEQRIIAEVGAIVARETDGEALLRSCEVPLARRLPRPFLAYALVDLVNGQCSFNAAPHERFPLTTLGHAAIANGQAAGSGESLPADHPGRRLGVEAVALTTPSAGGLPIGIRCITSQEPGHSFSESDLRLFRQVSAIIGPAMEALRANAAAAEQAALYNLILRSLSEAVVLLDEDLKVIFANENGNRLVNLVDPARTLRTLDAHLPRLPARVGEQLRGALAERKPGRDRVRFEMDGATVWYDYEVVPLGDASLRLLIVASDVTAQARHEREEEEHREQMEQASRLAALGELVGGVAHELNNPLTAILGFAEVMGLSEAGIPLNEEISIIQKEALRARNIVRDLLFIARPGPVERGPVALGEVVAHIERLRRAAWSQQRIEVRVTVESDGSQLWGNENQLTQVLLNLVTNAEHAVAAGDDKRIRIEARATPGGETIIDVIDNGVGMDEATAGRVFEPLFTTKQGQGTGLGLSMSYSIIAAHDGRIEIDSRPGAGTRFRVTLPSHRPPAPVAALAAPAVPGSPAHVLVIDDEPSLRKVCQRLITSMGHECAVAEGSIEAAALAAETAFDLVLCDYRLAGETADDVLPALAAIDPGLVERIVIATGATTDSGVAVLTARYNLRLVAKPYGFDEISELVARIPAARARAS